MSSAPVPRNPARPDQFPRDPRWGDPSVLRPAKAPRLWFDLTNLPSPDPLETDVATTLTPIALCSDIGPMAASQAWRGHLGRYEAYGALCIKADIAGVILFH